MQHNQDAAVAQRPRDLASARSAYYMNLMPLSLVLAIAGVPVEGKNDGTAKVGAIGSIRVGDRFTPIRAKGMTINALRREIKDETRIDVSSELRPLVLDLEISERSVPIRNCGCTPGSGNGMCLACFAYLNTVAQRYARVAETYLCCRAVCFFTGGRGFHVYIVNSGLLTSDSAAAALNLLSSAVERKYGAEAAPYRSYVDLSVTRSQTHNLRLPLSVRDDGTIGCVATETLTRADVRTVFDVTPEYVDDQVRSLYDALYPGTDHTSTPPASLFLPLHLSSHNADASSDHEHPLVDAEAPAANGGGIADGGEAEPSGDPHPRE